MLMLLTLVLFFVLLFGGMWLRQLSRRLRALERVIQSVPHIASDLERATPWRPFREGSAMARLAVPEPIEEPSISGLGYRPFIGNPRPPRGGQDG